MSKHDQRSMSRNDLRHVTGASFFTDPARSHKNLSRLIELFITSGSSYTVNDFSQVLELHLAVSPDADMALNNLLRFAEASVSRASLFNDLVRYPVVVEVLMKVFGFSQYFADILVRDPELFRWLTASDVLMHSQSKEYYSGEMGRVQRTFQARDRRVDALKRLYRREMLRIGTRDILGSVDLSVTTGELSDLADSLIEGACILAREQLQDRFKEPPRTTFAIIGLGKLGGRELNYSSDVDLMFVCHDEGDAKASDGRLYSHHEYFNKLSEKIVQNLSQTSTEGYLYRVDTRLRPESGAGPLARSVSSYLFYYESRGELWERQMLIKARPVAGDHRFGNEFLRQLDPFVYPRTFFEHPARSVARIKARIESELSGPDNIKLRPGGIRDIEFIVQVLQLLNGGKNHDLREPNTMKAIEKLEGCSLLSVHEAGTLRNAYVFFRTLEHRLQMAYNTQTHTLPQEPRARTTLARRMSFESEQDMNECDGRHALAVKALFDSTLSGTQVPAVDMFLADDLKEESMASFFRSNNFRDIPRAYRNIRSVMTGSALTGQRDLDRRAREAFAQIAKDLLKAIAGTPSPDMTLHNFASLAGGQKFPEAFYRQLATANFRNLVVSICGMSPRFVKGLVRHPAVLEAAATGFEQGSSRSLSLVRAKQERELSAGIRHLLGQWSYDQLTVELSLTADEVLGTVFRDVQRQLRLKRCPLAVLALGKYGTREIIFDADLDLLLVSGAVDQNSARKLAKLAEEFVGALSRVSEEGTLYTVDARLRPEGRSAPLVTEHESYVEYLHLRASLWERQSLTRLRFVCGDPVVGRAVTKDVQEYVYNVPLPDRWIENTVAMRKRMETRTRTMRQVCDIKLGAGGMVDMEFMAQILQLMFGATDSRLREGTTREVLAKAAPAYVTDGEAQALSSWYSFLRDVEKLMRITLEERSTVLPEGEKLHVLARCFGRGNGDELMNEVNSVMDRTRTMFLGIARRLSGRGGV